MTGNDQNNTGSRLELLRRQMQKHGIDGYLVPRADEWQGEYVPARAARLAWLTNFTGSSGIALVAAAKAAVYSDSRYTLQMNAELDAAAFEGQTAEANNGVDDWLRINIPAGGKVGYDPRLHTVREIAERQKKLEAKNITLVPVDENLVDAVWDDQPGHPSDKVTVYPDSIAGQTSAAKRDAVADDLKKSGAAALLVTEPDAVAWLLNIRGTDVPNTPFALSYLILHGDGHADWFIPPEKITDEVRRHVGNHVTIHGFDAVPRELAALAGRGKVAIDENTAPQWFKTTLDRAGVENIHLDNPIVARKATKNATEQEHIINAHIKDGVALVKFWKWVDERAPQGGLTEIAAAEKLRELRSAQQGFRDNSFDAIVGWAGNGAIVHYRASEKTNATITTGNLLLVDSGGQYLGGTTDNTRTRAIGTPTAEMKQMFTRVLKGHIAIADARFGDGTTGRDIDMLARQFLRKAGLDYGHGTGHGVGAHLSVHEAGAGISKRFTKPLKPGMLISNEPGYYKTGFFGIRIENLVFVVETGDPELKYKFNTVSLTPIDLKLIDADLLDADEIRWLNDYHKRVFDTLSPHLDSGEKDWLKRETAPIRRAPAP